MSSSPDIIVILTAHGCGPCHLMRNLGDFRTEPQLSQNLGPIPDGFGWDANFFLRLLTGTSKPIDYGGQEIKLPNVEPQTEVQKFTPARFEAYELHSSDVHARDSTQILEFTHFFLNLETVPGESGYRVHIRRRRYIRGDQDSVSLSSDGADPVLIRRQTFTKLLASAIPNAFYAYLHTAGFPAFGICSRAEWQKAHSNSSYVPYMLFGRQYTVPVQGVWTLVGARTDPLPPVYFVESQRDSLQPPTSESMTLKTETSSTNPTTEEVRARSARIYTSQKRSGRFIPQYSQ